MQKKIERKLDARKSGFCIICTIIVEYENISLNKEINKF